MDKLLSTQGKSRARGDLCRDALMARKTEIIRTLVRPRTMPALADKLRLILCAAKCLPHGCVTVRAREFQRFDEAGVGQNHRTQGTYAGTTVTATEPVFGYMAERARF